MTEKEIRRIIQQVMYRLDQRARRAVKTGVRKVVVPSMLGASLALSSGCGDGRSVNGEYDGGLPDSVAQMDSSGGSDSLAGPLYAAPEPDGGAIPPYMAPEPDAAYFDLGPQPEYIAPGPDGGPIPPYMAPDGAYFDLGPQPEYIAPEPDSGPAILYSAPSVDMGDPNLDYMAPDPDMASTDPDLGVTPTPMYMAAEPGPGIDEDGQN